jgi:hypothetical protein
MKRDKMRMFNAEGLAIFSSYVKSGKETPAQPPIGLLFDDKYSEEVDFCALPDPGPFQSKFDMGMSVVAAAKGRDNLQKLFPEPRVWAWLSLYFHESTMPKEGGSWKIKASARHLVERIPGRHQDQSHRHLVKAAVINVARFNANARVLMDQAHGQSKIEEQVMSRRTETGLANSLGFIQVLNKLYWDEARGIVRRGAKGDGPGSIMRLIAVVSQLDVNYDIPSLTAAEYLNLLPQAEFGRFLEKASKN